SGGVPRQLHPAAQAVLRQEPASPAPEQPPVAERGAAREAVRDSAAAPVAPAIREEIEQLRRAVAGERTPDPPFSPRARLLVGAFALAVVAGLGTAVLRPPSKSAPSEPPPARQQPVRTIPGEAAASLVARDDPKLPAVPQPRAPEDAPMGSDRDPRGPVVSPPLAPEPIAEAEAPTPVGAIAAAPAPVAEGAPPAAGPPVSVNVNATPWATIEVDGETLGETPLAGIALAAGSHTFRATLPDGRIVERVVEIDAENRFVVFDGAPAAPP
ncbi:MAG: hypothetical protein ACE5FL_08180, partial [Myxococcota bacterium]